LQTTSVFKTKANVSSTPFVHEENVQVL